MITNAQIDELVKFVKKENPKVANKVLDSIREFFNLRKITVSADIDANVVPRGRDKSYVTKIIEGKESKSQFVMTEKESVRGDESRANRQGK